MSLAYKFYKWVFFLPMACALTFIFGLAAALISILINPETAHKFVKYWGRSICFITPAMVTVWGKHKIVEHQSYVVVANHSSIYDILTLYGWLNIDFKWVMKQELRKVPGLGIGCEKMGHIFIDRSTPKAAINSINTAKHKITNGTSVLFFAEGTRSEDGTLKEFKKGAFHFATDLELPILPVSLHGTYEINPGKSLDLKPGNITMFIHEPIDTTTFLKNHGHTPETLDLLIQTTRLKIQTLL